MGGDWTEDTRLVLARARTHQKEFNAILNGDQPPPLWSIDEKRKADGTYTYALVVDSSRLKAAKPVAADLANNIVHTLDQLVGAIARLYRPERNRDTYFPSWSIDDAKFERKLRKLEQYIRADAVRDIREVRLRNRHRLPFAEVVKEISNSGKHWALIPSQASVKAVAVVRGGQPEKIWSIPESDLGDYFYPLCDSPERIAGPFRMVVGFRLAGLDPDVVATPVASPENIFGETLRYVEDMVTTLCGPEQ